MSRPSTRGSSNASKSAKRPSSDRSKKKSRSSKNGGTSRTAVRPVLYQLCRAGERFEVGDGPFDLSDVTDTKLIGRGDPRRSKSSTIYVDDPWMSSRHAQIIRGEARSPRFFIEDLESTNGVLLNGDLIGREPLADGDLIETGRTFWVYIEEPGDIPLPTEPYEFGTWSTWSPQLARDLKRLDKGIQANEHVLISGPEGAGKGFLTRTVHLMSGRAGRLVHLDCRERRPSRLVIDLFGGEGQVARLREADMGTLFLENIDALPRDLQDRLVDTLKKGGFVPDGKDRRVKCDVRVIASCPGNTEDLIRDGVLKKRFVETLSGMRVRLPSLEKRRPDLGLLLDDFLARARGAPALSRDACRAVIQHRWVLETKALARVIESAATLALSVNERGDRQGQVELEHLPLSVVGVEGLKAFLPEDEPQRPPSYQAADLNTDEIERAEIPQPEDEERTSEFDLNRHHVADPDPEATSDGLTHAVEEIRQMVAGFDELDPTDPSVRQQMVAAARRDHRGPSVRALDVSEPDEPDSAEGFESRPPSAYHDIESIERSYASAVDPDLIVDALRRSRGNVSAASRFLGRPRAQVLKWMREFQLVADDYRDG